MSRILIAVRRVMGDGKSRVINVILRLVSGCQYFRCRCLVLLLLMLTFDITSRIPLLHISLG